MISKFLKKLESSKDINPYYDEIINFTNEIRNLLESVNISIDDNVKKMPGASKKIFKVTEATEQATTEILDAVDGLMNKVDIAKNKILSLNQTLNDERSIGLDLITKMTAAIKSGADMTPFLEDMNVLGDRILAERNTVKTENENVSEINSLIDSISNDSTQIMMSSQVQDITSQQLAAVNFILETIQGKLTTIIHLLDTKVERKQSVHEEHHNLGTNVSNLHRQIAFDPDAINAVHNKDKRQDIVEDIVAKHKSGTLTNEDLVEEIKPDDILYDNEQSPAFSDRQDGGANEEISMDDIDALFAGQAPPADEEVDQDDINALFGNI